MSADIELLRLAAKAAGIKINEKWQAEREEIGRGDLGLWTTTSTNWNPLEDDGDALRLAVKLNLIIGPFATYVSVAETYDKPKLGAQGREFVCWHHETKGDQLAATRRAIVRAAAEIGRAMP